MESAQFQMAQEIFAERTEVGAIAKTAWSNADELPTATEQALNKGDEAGVEVAGFDSDRSEGASFGGGGIDFSIGWIRDRHIEEGRVPAEQVTGETSRHVLDEVGAVNGEGELDTGSCAALLAFKHRRSERVQNLAVQFVKCRFDGTNAVEIFAAPRNECGS